MLSVRADAPYCAQLCPLSTVACDIMGEETTGAERAQTRPAFPGCGGSVDAGHLSVRVCPTPLSSTGLCDRRTSGGQGITKTTHHGSNPPRKFGKTRRNHRLDGGCQRLASCIWAAAGALTIAAGAL